MKKRIGSLLMALVLALSLVPATVWAADGATEVGTFEELKQAVSDKATDIVVTNDIELTERLTVAAGITIRSQEGSVFTLKRSESFTPASDNTDYRFKLDYGADLTFRNIILDGNKEAGQAKNGFFRVNDTKAKLTLGQGATIQNWYWAVWSWSRAALLKTALTPPRVVLFISTASLIGPGTRMPPPSP